MTTKLPAPDPAIVLGLNAMDVPDHKRELRPSNCLWLLRNLGVRNRRHEQYIPVMRWLLAHVVEQNLVKRSEAAKIEDDLTTVLPPAPPPGDGLLDHQRQALASLKLRGPRMKMLVPTKTNKGR